jgi:hypothetical protein
MGKAEKHTGDKVLPEFGVTQPELDADFKRRIASLDAGKGQTTEQLREKVLQRQLGCGL